MNPRGGITGNFETFLSHSTEEGRQKFVTSKNFYYFKCISSLNEHFITTVLKNFWENVFLCLCAPLRCCHRQFLDALKNVFMEKLDSSLCFRKKGKNKVTWKKFFFTEMKTSLKNLPIFEEIMNCRPVECVKLSTPWSNLHSLFANSFYKFLKKHVIFYVHCKFAAAQNF